MDWQSLKAQMRRDTDLSRRTFELQALSKVRDGQLYDHLPIPFSDERNPSGEYVPMAHRRPSCQSNLCALVVSNSASLLFSEQHFPGWLAETDETLAMLEDLSKHTRLNEIMIDAALRGSAGSAVLWLRVLKNRPYIKVLETTFLTPSFDPAAPDTLVQVRERYKVDAPDLIEMGYEVEPNSGQYWFMRVWDTQDELWFHPKPVGEPGGMRQDIKRSTHHGLGFCPMIWVKNLPGPSAHGSEFDGACTFQNGIDTVIEHDYLLSQGGRGLKYSSDPTLVISGSETSTAPKFGGAANALVLEVGSAELLEITGGAAGAVLEQCKHLRELALESMAGVRTAPERIVGATSGKAMEMLHTPTLWLADKLRISYGEIALVDLARMVCAASSVVSGGLLIGDNRYAGLDSKGIGLRWGPWFSSSPLDDFNVAQAFSLLIDHEVISRETATRILGVELDIEDTDAERGLIEGEAKAQEQRQVDLAVQSKPAVVGPSTTR